MMIDTRSFWAGNLILLKTGIHSAHSLGTRRQHLQMFFHPRQDFTGGFDHGIPDRFMESFILGRPSNRFGNREEDDAWRFECRSHMRYPAIITDNKPSF